MHKPMTDLEPSEDIRPQAFAEKAKGNYPPVLSSAVAFPAASAIETVSFDRGELRAILDLYGRKVAEGEWRDYAIDFTAQKAVFSIFRRASEYPLYRIEKNPKLARKQGAYSVITTTGLILKRGHDLARVIAVLDKRLKLVLG